MRKRKDVPEIEEATGEYQPTPSDLAFSEFSEASSNANVETVKIDPQQENSRLSLSSDMGQTEDFDPNATRDFQAVFGEGSKKNSSRSIDERKGIDDKKASSIPGYQLIDELGRGGMGVVFKAKQVHADRIVALKLMLNVDHARPEEIARFGVEVRAAANLKHPNIVQVYDVGSVGKAPYFTQEYLSGGSLSEKIRDRLLSHRETAEAILQLSQAMAYAHSKGIVHRDLKPANVLIGDQGELKIADFGLARRTEDQSHLTRDGTILGTPSYMAPEQASGSIHDIGPLSDVYTLGAILYELLTGRPPFKGATVWEVINLVRSAEPTSPTALRPDTPKDLETICLKCLQKDPAKRYASAGELADDVQRHLKNEPILARPISRRERFVRLCRRHPREAALVGTLSSVLLLFAIGATWAAVRMAQQRDQIAAEKETSDQRLDLYRGTVSSFVNRIPQVLDNAPFAAGLRSELNQLVDELMRNTDTSAAMIGPSQQWGLAGVLMRRGEAKLSEAQGASAETRDAAMSEAEKDLDQAAKIMQQVLDSEQGDRAKALANLALVKSAQASSRRIAGHPEEAQSLYREAIDDRRKALLVVETEKSIGLRQAELGRELANYSEALMELARVKTIAAEKRQIFTEIQPLTQEATELLSLGVAAHQDKKDLLPNMLRDLTIACELSSQVCIELTEIDQAISFFEKGLASAKQLVQLQPDRVANVLNAVRISSQYGDFLLTRRKDATAARKLYVEGYLQLRPLTLSKDLSNIQEQGLAMSYYRLGVATLWSGDAGKAKGYFERCTMIRELELRQLLEDRALRENPDRLLEKRIGLMLSQARSGLLSQAVKEARQLIERANQETPLEVLDRKTLYVMASACLGIASENSPDSEREALLEEAMDAMMLAIESGFHDVDYFETDPDLLPLQRSARFPALKTRMEQAPPSDTE